MVQSKSSTLTVAALQAVSFMLGYQSLLSRGRKRWKRHPDMGAVRDVYGLALLYGRTYILQQTTMYWATLSS